MESATEYEELLAHSTAAHSTAAQQLACLPHGCCRTIRTLFDCSAQYIYIDGKRYRMLESIAVSVLRCASSWL
jgi:hypothetical protein